MPPRPAPRSFGTYDGPPRPPRFVTAWVSWPRGTDPAAAIEAERQAQERLHRVQLAEQVELESHGALPLGGRLDDPNEHRQVSWRVHGN